MDNDARQLHSATQQCKLVRIDDKISGVKPVDINRKNVVLQIEEKQNSYSLK